MEYEEMKADEFMARTKFETIFGAISHDRNLYATQALFCE